MIGKKKMTIMPRIYGDIISVDSLISYYRLDGDVTDALGINYGMGNSDVYTTGVNGQGAEFIGDDSRSVSIGSNSSDFNFGNGVNDNPFSISFFVKFNSVGSYWLVSNRASTTVAEYQIYLFGPELGFTLYNNGGTTSYIRKKANFTTILSTWYHITVTYDGSGSENGLNIYVNGINGNGTADNIGGYIAMNNTNQDLYLGNPNWSSTFSLDGVMDGFGIFNKELTPEEVLGNYNLQLTQELV